MRTVLIGRLTPLVLTIVAVPWMSLAGASAVSGTDYDSFDAVTLNDVSSTGDELPYAGGVREFESTIFDTSTFTLQPGEDASNGSLHACLTPTAGVAHAGRTGWVRFNPGANGRIHVLAETPTYDSVLMVRAATESPWRTATLSQLGSSVACSDQDAGPGNEAVPELPVTGDRVYYIQVGSRCGGGPSTCQDPSTPGGPTRIRVRFTPHDTDTDGVPDAQDNCEGQGLPGRVTVDGCPDADLDGISDSADACPLTAGVPAPAPYDGCPAGPRPPDPSNNPYVRIESPTGDAYSTSTRRVLLHLNWPKGTVSAVIRNRHARTRIRAVSDVVRWRLPATKRPGTRGVRVRFRGPHVPDVIVGDTIRYDPAPPEVAASVLLRSGEGWYVGVQLTDRGTGISAVTLLDEEMKPIEDEEVCSVDDCQDDVDLALSTLFRRPAYIQVVDSSGNVTETRLQEVTAASERCAGSVIPYRRTTSDLACVVVRQRCGELKPLLRWWVSTEVRCRRVNGAPYRVVPK